MKTRALLIIALVFAVVAPAYADRRSEAKAYVGFGIELAQKQIWGAAATQFEKAVELDETYAAGWNNLGVAYEQLGKFEEARKAYDRALAIEPGNQFINNNNDQFREIYDRQNRRRRR
jgi:Tfp pilus assembly protein PilF